MTTGTDVLKYILPLAAVLLAAFLENIINVRRVFRYRQFLLPFIAFVLVIPGAYLCIRYYDLTKLLVLYGEWLENSNIAVINIALWLAFLVVKCIILPILNKVWRNRALVESLCGKDYEYDEDYSMFFLKAEKKDFRGFVFGFTIAMCIATVVLLTLTWHFGEDSVLWLKVFPTAADIVLIEYYSYINGQTRKEYEYTIFGTQADSRNVANYSKIRDILEKTLTEPRLNSCSGQEYANKETPALLLKAMSDSGDILDKAISIFFNTEDRYKRADIDCVQATSDLMHRKNVIFLNPFYRDLEDYITLPLATTLLKGKKVLVVTGRNSTVEDVVNWFNDISEDFSHMKTLWRVERLDKAARQCEIGVMDFRELYDSNVIEKCRPFFHETDFVILLEPSAVATTGQVALNILSDELAADGIKPVYCICDRNADGLVDTMSHVIKDEITDVVATPVPRCTYTGMGWNADGDFIRQQLFGKEARFLGNGIEIASVAIKNQIPHVTWFSETKAPVRDIRWIAGTCYAVICRYMNLPAQQKEIYDRISFKDNIWDAEKQRAQFIIAEDEFCNMFSTMRLYLSRGNRQSFVNVLSENYLLRDYMRCNYEMLMSDSNILRSIVPDYAKTERNTLIKLLVNMGSREVSEDEIISEFALAGTTGCEVFSLLGRLLRKYTFADISILTIRTVKKNIDEFNSSRVNVYSISPSTFDDAFRNTLKSAFFIVEDEKNNGDYIDAKFFTHVPQKVIPGQFITYNGKYYEVKYISTDSGVILRRASNLYDSRKYYRQIRNYELIAEGEIISRRKINDIEISHLEADFSSDTTGYLEMTDAHNLRTAKTIDISEDPTQSLYFRKYRNKEIIRVNFSETDTDMLFTLSMLLNEVFRSLFPDSWQYITVTTKRPEHTGGMLNYLVPDIKGISEDGCLYIIEDSEIDLGLLGAFDRNFTYIMEIITDFLAWHEEKMKEPEAKDPIPPSIDYDAKKAENKRQSLLDKFRAGLSSILKRPKKDSEDSKESGEFTAPDAEKASRQSFWRRRSKKGKPEASKPEPSKEDSKPDTAADAPEQEKTSEPEQFTLKPSAEAGQDKPAGEKAPEPAAEKTEAVAVQSVSGRPSESAPAPGQNGAEAEKDPSPANNGESSASGNNESNADEADDGKQDSFVLGQSSDDSETLPETAAPARKLTPKEVEDRKRRLHVTDNDSPEIEAIPGTDIFETPGSERDLEEVFETQFKTLGIISTKKTRYQNECFLKFGFDRIDKRIRTKDLYAYLRVRGYSNNNLTKARTRKVLTDSISAADLVNVCDFCGMPLNGVSYEVLTDGRTRCDNCSKSAVTTLDDFREIFYQVMEMMENIYGATYHVPIKVEMCDAKQIGKRNGYLFRGIRTEKTPRVTGYAKLSKGELSLCIENGSPRICALETMSHEMTHIWQYINWNLSQISSIYGMTSAACTNRAELIVLEGMATWASVQYLYAIGESYHASIIEKEMSLRTDEYGLGFNLYRDTYPFVTDTSKIIYSPFNTFPPVEPALVKGLVAVTCKNKKCRCK